MADRREFVGTYECMGGTTYAADFRWATLGEAEEVVRCMDCVSYDESIGAGWCWACDCGTQPDGFCHRGERRVHTP